MCAAKLGGEWLRGKEARQRWLLHWLKKTVTQLFSVHVSTQHIVTQQKTHLSCCKRLLSAVQPGKHPRWLRWGGTVGYSTKQHIWVGLLSFTHWGQLVHIIVSVMKTTVRFRPTLSFSGEEKHKPKSVARQCFLLPIKRIFSQQHFTWCNGDCEASFPSCFQ